MKYSDIYKYKDGGNTKTAKEKPWGEMTPKERAAYLDTKEKQKPISKYKADVIAKNEEEKSREQAKKEYYKDYVVESTKKTLEHPIFNTAQYFTPEGMAIGSIKGLANLGPDISKGDYKSAAFDVLSASPVIASSIKNIYKINPWAEKLNKPSSSYRVAGLDAYEDFKNTNILRSKSPEAPAGATLQERAMIRPTSFPSFQKGYADLRYLPEEGGVVFKTDLPTYKRGDINPVTGNEIRGRHYAHRVIDPKTGATVTNIPASNIEVYGSEPHWLKGYQKLSYENGGIVKYLKDNYYNKLK